MDDRGWAQDIARKTWERNGRGSRRGRHQKTRREKGRKSQLKWKKRKRNALKLTISYILLKFIIYKSCKNSRAVPEKSYHPNTNQKLMKKERRRKEKNKFMCILLTQLFTQFMYNSMTFKINCTII